MKDSPGDEPADHPRRLTRYDWSRSYRWNYAHAPAPEYLDPEDPAPEHLDPDMRDPDLPGSTLAVPPVPGSWDFLGFPVASPLGVAAGPLLNGNWCRYYAERGFDVVTYKTVRSDARECYPLPNLQPVRTEPLIGGESVVAAQPKMSGSWAVSFGMPSSPPEVWRRDVEETRRALRSDQVLSVSVVGTVQPGWSMQQLAEDYARCAKWSVESGADCVEANFSCPNVSTCDGQLYQNVNQSHLVASALRRAVGSTPLIVKIGHVNDEALAASLVSKLDGVVDAISMTNSIATRVQDDRGELMFDGEQRGICGEAIRDASIQQVSRFSKVIRRSDASIRLIGVGGICNERDVRQYLDAGAHSCHLATAVMTDPNVGIRIRHRLTNQKTND